MLAETANAMISRFALAQLFVPPGPGADMAKIRAYSRAIFPLFQLPDSSCRRVLPNRLRPPDGLRPNPFPVHSVNQSHELSMIELDPVVADPRPAELRV
ncbi:hypothetical protein NKI19_32055, partial [Mesorhizobium sp. M0751]|uniref:hypothetical protein n=1 Tax=Mesorhizobium sp. M0751 TaxID=2956992 RepID=UPI00333B3781